MLNTFSTNALEFMEWPWSQIEPHYQELIDCSLKASNISSWLADWSKLADLLQESLQRLYVAITVDTTDQQAKHRYDRFLDDIYPQSQAADQKMKEKILASGLEQEGFHIPLRNLRAEVEVYCEANLPLLAQDLKLSSEYDGIIGAQTITWEDKELTLSQIQPIYQDPDRRKRESAWRLAAERQLVDRDKIGELWKKLMQVRGQISANAHLSDFRAYRWKRMLRFDYTPDDCIQFHRSIEMVAVPAAQRIYERRRQKLGLKTLRPWDLFVDPHGFLPLIPFTRIKQLENGVAEIFRQVDPELGEYFQIMLNESLLDLENRKGKAPGGYCTEFAASQKPFICMNSVGLHDDVQTLIHEGGHAFHVFESARLPYFQQKQVGLEFCEVASMGMELLASPYLVKEKGGFYSLREAAQARIEFLETAICFWPYMAVVDAFQHWVYQNHQDASNTANCDAKWAELWDKYMVGLDWNGLEQEKTTGWHRKQHIHGDPFYYVEYGFAQLGAIQVWRNALQDQAGAVAAYRKALALGGTVSLPDLFSTAGARFAFDVDILRESVDLAEKTIRELESHFLE
jgi:oligoendopeptidase F